MQPVGLFRLVEVNSPGWTVPDHFVISVGRSVRLNYGNGPSPLGSLSSQDPSFVSHSTKSIQVLTCRSDESVSYNAAFGLAG